MAKAARTKVGVINGKAYKATRARAGNAVVKQTHLLDDPATATGRTKNTVPGIKPKVLKRTFAHTDAERAKFSKFKPPVKTASRVKISKPKNRVDNISVAPRMAAFTQNGAVKTEGAGPNRHTYRVNKVQNRTDGVRIEKGTLNKGPQRFNTEIHSGIENTMMHRRTKKR